MLTTPPAQSNVATLLAGRDVLSQLEIPAGDFAVTTMALPWQICEDRLAGKPASILIADSMEKRSVERQIEAVPSSVRTVLAIGGGRAIDLGKYLAYRRGLRLITVPTVLSVDAFVTPAAGLRENGRVVYLGETTPDPLVIDYDILRTAPPELNIAGVGDLLSIHTATHDWRRAARAGKSEYPFSEEACARAENVLQGIMNLAEPIRDNSDLGLQAIVDGYLEVNQVCLPAGHYRVEEGSEHYLFYELEERTGRAFVHGPIIGLGIHIMSRLQGNTPENISAFMNAVGLPHQPRDLGIDRATLKASLLNLTHYVRERPDLWYTVIDEASLAEGKVDDLLEPLTF